MEIKKDESYGIVPYILENDGIKFLLIHQLTHIEGETYWTFPKGHAENNESSIEAAKRELKEETGLDVINSDESISFAFSYSYIKNNVKIEKTATFYLGEVESKEYVLQEKEVKDAGWFTYEKAREKLTYEKTKKVLDEVIEYLKNK